MKAKPYTCLFCGKNFRTRPRAKKHSCSQKQEAEKRLGVKLATYDALQRFIEIEAENEKGR
jgi:hypothetical protein